MMIAPIVSPPKIEPITIPAIVPALSCGAWAVDDSSVGIDCIVSVDTLGAGIGCVIGKGTPIREAKDEA